MACFKPGCLYPGRCAGDRSVSYGVALSDTNHLSGIGRPGGPEKNTFLESFYRTGSMLQKRVARWRVARLGRTCLLCSFRLWLIHFWLLVVCKNEKGIRRCSVSSFRAVDNPIKKR